MDKTYNNSLNFFDLLIEISDGKHIFDVLLFWFQLWELYPPNICARPLDGLSWGYNRLQKPVLHLHFQYGTPLLVRRLWQEQNHGVSIA